MINIQLLFIIWPFSKNIFYFFVYSHWMDKRRRVHKTSFQDLVSFKKLSIPSSFICIDVIVPRYFVTTETQDLSSLWGQKTSTRQNGAWKSENNKDYSENKWPGKSRGKKTWGLDRATDLFLIMEGFGNRYPFRHQEEEIQVVKNSVSKQVIL